MASFGASAIWTKKMREPGMPVILVGSSASDSV